MAFFADRLDERGWQPPKPKRTGRFRNFALLFGFLGIVAASPIGQTLYVISLITVIGIPFAAIIWVLPTLGLVVCLAFVVWRVLPHRGYSSIMAAFGMTIAALFIFPSLHNVEINRTLATLQGRDVGAPSGPIGIGRDDHRKIGLVKKRDRCEETCVWLLMSGQAQEVLIARQPRRGLDPDFSSDAVAYRLENHLECPDQRGVRGGVRVHSKHFAEKTANTIAGDYARLQDRGVCVVRGEATLSDAELVAVSLSNQDARQPSTISPVPSLISTGRTALYERVDDGKWAIRWQQTPTRASLLKTPLLITFHTGAQLSTKTEFWRTAVRDDRTFPTNAEILRRAGFSFPGSLR